MPDPGQDRQRIGVDIGGTFTDLVIQDADSGETRVAKVLTTVADRARAVIQGLAEHGGDPAGVEFLIHGTTAGLNAFLERRGAKVALVTTAGFGDVYTIGTGERVELFELHYRKPEPLIRNRDVHTVRERMRVDATVEQELVEEDVIALAAKLREEGIESVAVCLIHAHLNPEHELAVGRLLAEHAPELDVSLSHQLAREWREHARMSTTVLNAFISPVVSTYLGSLTDGLDKLGVGAELHVMQSNGGAMSAAAAKRVPIQTLLSGPVGGTIGGREIGRLLGRENLICVDMGGTSFDASMIAGGQASSSTALEIERMPLLLPAVDIHTIGAGGSSVAYLENGSLRVGPRSAGASPGPACYGLGGTEPTVTDANLVLGRIDPESIAGGSFPISRQLAEEAIGRLAAEVGLEMEALAEGIVEIVNAKMANALRTITVGKGIDPRRFSLLAFGGAGPVHVAELAEQLEIGEILVPPHPGTFSAWGMLQADVSQDMTRPWFAKLDETDPTAIESAFGELEAEAAEALSRDRAAGEITCQRSADLRYVGQEYALEVPLAGAPVDAAALAGLADRFHGDYGDRYGHSTPAAPVETVNLRVRAIVAVPRPPIGAVAAVEEPGEERSRSVRFAGRRADAPLRSRRSLAPGEAVPGPLIVEESTTSTVVPPGWQIAVGEGGTLVMTRVGGADA